MTQSGGPDTPRQSAARRFASAWRVAGRIVRITFRSQLEYRVEFLLTIAIGAVWQVSVIVFATVLLTRFSGMGGWSSADVLLIAGTQMLAHGLFVLCFGRVAELPRLVQEGAVDAYLLRPMPVHRQLLLAHFPTNAIGDLLVALGLFLGALARSTVAWTPARICFLAAAVVGGTLVEAAVNTAISAAALHFPATSYWTRWVAELTATFGTYPLSILPRVVGGAFTFVLPIAFIAYVPVGVLTGHTAALGVPGWLAVGAPLAGPALYPASRLLWNRSLGRYSGVNG